MSSLTEELLSLCIELAQEAGDLVRAGRRDTALTADTKSSSVDVVTQFDRASEELIVGRLAVARPDDGLVGEEGADRVGTSGVTWLIDPIDGTTNFLYGLAGYAVSIAAYAADGALAAAVYLPATDELFSAARGYGAHLNGVEIRTSACTALPTALVGTGFGYLAERRARQGARVARLLPQVRDIRRIGAAAADLCYVACGRLDAYYEQYLNPWDRAAGTLIAAEAGAIVGSFTGSPGEPDGLLVAPPTMYEPFHALVESCGAPD